MAESFADHNYFVIQDTETKMSFTPQNDASGSTPNPDNVSTRPTEENWQTVENKNNKRTLICSKSTEGLDPKRNRITLDSSNNPIFTSNKYQALDAEDNSMEDETFPQNSEPKPPPIFIPGVNNVIPMNTFLVSLVEKSGYTYKSLSQDKIKVLPNTVDAYRKIVKGLTEKNISFYTYQLKQERAYRAVLKQMHHSTCIDDLKTAIEDHGHKVRNLVNVKSNTTKEPLPLFFVDLEPNSNNKTIFDIQYLLNAKIRFEPPYKKKEVVQCKRCQNYGHTKSYCYSPFKCVKCGESHETSKCTKPLSVPAKCALCNGEHPASYKGCPIYKEIQKKQFPPLRKKVMDSCTDENSVQSGNKPRNYVPPRVVSDKISYAQITKNESAVHKNSNSEDLHQLAKVIQDSFSKFENILIKQSEQISTLLNLLSSVVSRIK